MARSCNSILTERVYEICLHVSIMDRSPDPPSSCHLLCCLRSLLLAAYCLYASVGAPRRLASNTFLVPRDSPKSLIIIAYKKISGGFWEAASQEIKRSLVEKLGSLVRLTPSRLRPASSPGVGIWVM